MSLPHGCTPGPCTGRSPVPPGDAAAHLHPRRRPRSPSSALMSPHQEEVTRTWTKDWHGGPPLGRGGAPGAVRGSTHNKGYPHEKGYRMGLNGSVPLTSCRPEIPECAWANASSLARSPMLFDAGSGARPRVESTPIALPPGERKPEPESPGMPGLTV